MPKNKAFTKTKELHYVLTLFSGGNYTLVSNINNRLVSTFIFPDIDPELFNNTVIMCVDDVARSTSESFSMAGECTLGNSPCFS